jgi:hypothetical protein
MRLLACLVAVGIATLAAAAPAHAAVLDVVGFADTTPGSGCDGITCLSIRAALVTAARLSGTDTINVPAGAYRIANGQLRITSDVVVVGENARTTVLSGDTKNARIFDVVPGNAAVLSSLTLTHGSADTQDPPYGGGVLNRGTLLLDHVRVTGNRAPLGGGVANYQGALTVQYTLIDHNTASSAGGAGGLSNLGDATAASLSMRDSTVAFNAGALAGGILVRGHSGNSTTLQRVTIAHNSGGARGYGGLAIDSDGETFGVGATIVADNTGTLSNNCGGTTPRDDGANVEGGIDCGFKSPSDRQNANPGLSDALVNAGGETDILAIPSSSVAADLAPPCLNVTDQRGLARPQGVGCDAGAYEVDRPPETQIDSGPSGTSTNNSPSFTFSSPEPNVAFQCRLDGPGGATGSYIACGSPRSYTGLADGTYTFLVRATDGGFTDATPATRTFTIDTTPPDTSITGGPTGPTNNTSPSFTLNSSEARSTFECRLDGPSKLGSYGACTTPKTYANLTQGAYTLLVRATDAVGHTDASPATRAFTIDTTPPAADVVSGPSGVTSDTSPAFGFVSPDAETTFECRLDGPGAAVGTFGDCTSPERFSALAPGEYTFRVRATDPAGNQTTTSRSFKVAAPQRATPTPTPTPEPGQSVVISPVSGTTLIEKPGKTTFEPVDFTQEIPLGSIVDARKSKIRLFAIPKPGAAAESALFYGGIFKVTQVGTVTQLQLVEALASCTPRRASASAKKPKTRKLWGDGSGSFRTRGQYSSATVRGTKWLVQDSCRKTLTTVARGVVTVQDFAKKKTVLVRAPNTYTARSKR